eukprot:TRINITY_DN5068_c0_g1_i1.p1 TRINITY_DN5068_c0_g1~~TRINITY_DN5068_c0_g1_i1.p1  ORF type:complete len:125 (+),score=23.59 TRINITY_DN5068_c0_g1_i1:49-423(+)
MPKRKSIPGIQLQRPQRRRRNAAVEEIRTLQNMNSLMIRKLPFIRVVKEIAAEATRRRHISDVRFQPMAINALQSATEMVLTDIFEDAYTLTIHAKRVTLFHKDLVIALRLRGLNHLRSSNFEY